MFKLIKIERILRDYEPYYTVNILGYKFKFLDISRYLRYAQKQTMRKMVLSDNGNVFNFDNTNMYVPLYPIDMIQREIVESKNFYEINLLKECDKYIASGCVIADIGANIGNHTVYWGLNNKVKHIYSFEPVKTTYNMLYKNIELNNLENKVTTFNVGVSDEKTFGCMCNYDMENIGGVNIRKSNEGKIQLDTLDNLMKNSKVDFIKIDAEGHECSVLRGAKQVISQNRPIIMIERCPESFEESGKILESYNYKLEQKIDSLNYIYIPINNL